MYTFEFESMGTAWAVLVDSQQFSPELEKKILERTTHFEQQFSRFIEGNEATAFRTSKAGTCLISRTLFSLLEFAQDLRQESGGVFDPAVGSLLELVGYDQQYSFKTSKKIEDWKKPDWQLVEKQLRIDGPVIFDVGGYGKGYWIDQIARMLEAEGHLHYLVDGGGDMYGTTKKNGDGWNIAIEYPGKKGYAISEVTLKNQGLANSDIFQRNWGEWNHVIEPTYKTSAKEIIGCSVIAKTAMIADGLTTALMLKPEMRDVLAKKYEVEFLMVTREQDVLKSESWKSEVFL